MQKVVQVSLHGIAVALEEGGYRALQAYLEAAARQLASDPDRDEILGDLEQAIAEKCARHLAPHRTAVTAAELARVLEEMGPVQPDVGPEAAPGGAGSTAPAAPAPRRLYRILEGGVLGGLCNGVGAYLGLDANVVRAVFVVLALLSHGAWLLVYLVLRFVVPAAGTSEERAAARGLPFGAQQLVDEAKRRYAQLQEELRGPWARFAVALRTRWQEPWRPPSPTAAAFSSAPVSYGRQLLAGMALPLLAAASAGVAIAWALASSSLVVNGSILGWTPPGVPLWAGLLVLLAMAMVIHQPFHHLRRALRRSPCGGDGLLAAWDSILWLGFLAFFAWLAWRGSGELRGVVHDLSGAIERVRSSWHPLP